MLKRNPALLRVSAVFVLTVTVLFSGRTVSAEASLKQMMRDRLPLNSFFGVRTQRKATSSFFRIMVQRSALGTYWHSVVCRGRSSVPTALAHCCDGQDRAIETTGPELLLNAAHAQTIALALHELATNAGKHGALSVPHGKLSVAWREERGWLRLEWVETGGPKVKAPSSEGYGMQVTRLSIQHLGGDIDFDWGPATMRSTISVPLGGARQQQINNGSGGGT